MGSTEKRQKVRRRKKPVYFFPFLFALDGVLGISGAAVLVSAE
jgi:hypothetical protein